MTKIRCYRTKCKFNDFCKTNCGFCTLEEIQIVNSGCMDFVKIKIDILTEIDKIEELNSKLDYITSNIDELLWDYNYDDVENLFEHINMETTNPLVLLSMLTITDSWKKYLPKRVIFYDKVERIVLEKFSKKKAKELLYDLK